MSQKEWTLKKDKNGIKVYTKDQEGSNTKNYRLTTQFNADFEEVLTLNFDFDNYENWVKDCEKSEVLKTEGDDVIVYYAKYHAPWPANDRDFVSKVFIQRTKSGATLTTQPANYKYPKEKGVVRVTTYKDEWKITALEGGLIKLELEGYYDPGGSIPKWIVNMFIVDGPYESIMRLKEKTKKAD